MKLAEHEIHYDTRCPPYNFKFTRNRQFLAPRFRGGNLQILHGQHVTKFGGQVPFRVIRVNEDKKVSCRKETVRLLRGSVLAKCN